MPPLILRRKAQRAPTRKRISPQLARPTPETPTSSGWVHEIKHDGHRIVAYLDRGKIRLITRNGNDATRRFAPVAVMLNCLPIKHAIIDGEVAVPDEDGLTHISLLDDALASGSLDRLAYYAFDLLFLNGKDLRRQPLGERKLALSKLLTKPTPPITLFRALGL